MINTFKLCISRSTLSSNTAVSHIVATPAHMSKQAIWTIVTYIATTEEVPTETLLSHLLIVYVKYLRPEPLH